MGIYLLDGIMCPALPLVGNPQRATYFYDTPEGQKDSEWRVTNSLVVVPDDDGDSWTASDYPHGANMVVVEDDTMYTQNLQAIYDRLVRAHANQKRCGDALTGEPPVVEVEGEFDPADTNKDGVVDKSERKAAKKDKGE